MFKPALNITEQIADFLSEKIVSGEIQGGERIQEVRLAKLLSVSRGSVREALLILERRHLISIVPRKGAQVNSLTSGDAREVTALLAMLEERYFCGITQRRQRMQACEQLQDVLSKMAGAAKDADVLAALRTREEFYAILLSDGSLHNLALFESLLPSSQRIFYELLTHTELDLFDVARYYQALVVAIAEGCDDRVAELVSAAARRIDSLCDGQFSAASSDCQARPVELRLATPVSA